MNILFFLHPGTNSRSNFIDVMHGCRALGHQVLTLELGPIWQLYSREPRLKPQLTNDITELVAAFIRSNDIHLSVSMWANSILSLSAYQRGAEVVSLFDVIERPHLLLWLDSPERAHEGGVRQYFRSSLFRSPYVFHHINNAGTAREMRAVYGFTNVLAYPYRVNETVYRSHENSRKEFDIVFGGGVMRLPG